MKETNLILTLIDKEILMLESRIAELKNLKLKILKEGLDACGKA